MKKYDKLVRDRIPEILSLKGIEHTTHTVLGDDFRDYLSKKLEEEVNEFIENPCLEELADIQEVVYGILSAYDWSASSLKATADEKRNDKGGFSGAVILKEVLG